MLWKQVCLSHPEAQPFNIEVDVPEGEIPKEYIRIDYGEQQENHILLQMVGVDKETQQAFYIRVQIYHGKELVWQLGDPDLSTTTRIQSALARLSNFTTEEDSGSIIQKSTLVLERIADDFEFQKMQDKQVPVV